MNLFVSLFLILISSQILSPAPRVAAPLETDPRLQADGRGWRVKKATSHEPQRLHVPIMGDSILSEPRAILETTTGDAFNGALDPRR